MLGYPTYLRQMMAWVMPLALLFAVDMPVSEE